MSSSPVTIGLLGFGYWGKNLGRNIALHPDLSLRYVVDPSTQQLDLARSLHPASQTSTEPLDAIKDSECDLLIVATPARTHFELTRSALKEGRHVMVTKPLARTVAEAEELAALAESVGRLLMVDHTFVFTGAVVKMRELIESGELGDLVYCSSMRVNLGTYRRDMSVIWDLGPHDVSILDAVGYGRPVAVSATAGGRMGGEIDQIANLTMFFDAGFIAHVNLSWLAPMKLRTMIIGGTDKMLVYDDLEPSEKVKVYDKGIRIQPKPTDDVSPSLIEYRLGDMWAPRLNETEALFEELNHIVRCVRGIESPIVDGGSGVNCVRILEAADRSADRAGDVVVLDQKGWQDYTDRRPSNEENDYRVQQ